MQSNPNFPLSSFRFGSYTVIGKDQQKKLAQIINNMIDIPQATDFLHPVPWKELQLDDYLDVIKHPMNLYRVQQKMKARDYTTVEQVLDHLQLIWDNCKEYNKEGYYFEIAQKMEKMLKKMIKNYIPSIQYSYQAKNASSIQAQHVQQPQSRKFNIQSALQPPARNAPQPRSTQKQAAERSQSANYKQQESQSQKQGSQQQAQAQQVPLSQKNRLHQRLKQITQQQLGQIVGMIQEFCSQAFKHISGGRYQILVDNIDAETFKKLNEKVDEFIENEKLNVGGAGNKKIKV